MRFPGHETVPIGNRVRVNAALKSLNVLLDLINLICFYCDNDYYETSLQATVLNANLVITISQSEL